MKQYAVSSSALLFMFQNTLINLSASYSYDIKINYVIKLLNEAEMVLSKIFSSISL